MYVPSFGGSSSISASSSSGENSTTGWSNATTQGKNQTMGVEFHSGNIIVTQQLVVIPSILLTAVVSKSLEGRTELREMRLTDVSFTAGASIPHNRSKSARCF